MDRKFPKGLLLDWEWAAKQNVGFAVYMQDRPNEMLTECKGTLSEVQKRIYSEEIVEINLREREIKTKKYLYRQPSGYRGSGNIWLLLILNLDINHSQSIFNCRFYPIENNYLIDNFLSYEFFIASHNKILMDCFSVVYEYGTKEFPKFKDESSEDPTRWKSDERRQAVIDQVLWFKFWRETPYGEFISVQEVGAPFDLAIPINTRRDIQQATVWIRRIFWLLAICAALVLFEHVVHCDVIGRGSCADRLIE